MDPIDAAFKAAPRREFLPDHVRYLATTDRPLPIGFGQTNSQPSTVRQMLEWLEVEPGNKILDVGSGSGWTTALLSNLAGSQGRVYAVEIIPELVEFGRQNCQRLGIRNVSFYQAHKTHGLKKFAPYDRILVSASTSKVPQELLDQLANGGKMVIPIKNDILEIERTNKQFETTTHPGFVFVPLVPA